MRLNGNFRFLGIESRPGFKDRTKINYLIALSQGIDTLRLYVEPEQFNDIQTKIMQNKIVPYGEVNAEFEYDPSALKVQYCMRLVNIKEIKGGN